MNRSIGLTVMNFAVAIYLLATGILGVTGKGSLFGKLKGEDEIRAAVSSIFKRGDFAEVLIVVLSVLAIVAGIFIILKFFGVEIPMMEICLIVLAIVWVVFIIMIDIVAPIKSNGVNFVEWLRTLGAHLMVLAGIALATERFGS